jgi:hypothetical protein
MEQWLVAMVGTLQQQHLQESATKEGIGKKAVSTKSCVMVSTRSCAKNNTFNPNDKTNQGQERTRATRPKPATSNKHITTTTTSIIHIHKQQLDNPAATATSIKSSSNSHTRHANSNKATNTATTPPPTKPKYNKLTIPTETKARRQFCTHQLYRQRCNADAGVSAKTAPSDAIGGAAGSQSRPACGAAAAEAAPQWQCNEHNAVNNSHCRTDCKQKRTTKNLRISVSSTEPQQKQIQPAARLRHHYRNNGCSATRKPAAATATAAATTTATLADHQQLRQRQQRRQQQQQQQQQQRQQHDYDHDYDHARSTASKAQHRKRRKKQYNT